MSESKLRAAREALTLVRSGMTVGLGSGSTSTLFIQELGKAVAGGSLRDIVGVPSSTQSETLARSLGITLVGFDATDACDLYVDGADEVDPDLGLIKGLGGALLREKIVTQNSRRMIVIVDDSKLVSRLGTKGPLPVEVTRFALPAHERFLRSLGAEPTLRMNKKTADGPLVTDNGNFILDCTFAGGMADAAKVADALANRAGIVEHGLFLGMAEMVIVAGADGKVQRRTRG